jgi:surface protein
MDPISRQLFIGASAGASDPMILVFNTNLGTTTVTLPMVGAHTITVNWGDGLSDSYSSTVSANRTHTYAANGTYTVQIYGTAFGFGGTTSRPQLTKCLSFGALGLQSLSNGFRACANLNEVPSSLPSTVTNLSGCFQSATSFNFDISGWNVANVTNMSSMFLSATAFNQNIGSWNVANVTSMSSMFESATAFNQNIGSWNVANVTSMTSMFRSASAFNQNIGSWNVAKVGNMENMFRSATAFNQNIGSWNVANVLTMAAMFQSASAFNQNIGSWNVIKVTNMASMFNAAAAFNQSIGSWNVSNVDNMFAMFQNATVFNQNLSNWCVGWITAEPGSFSSGSALTAGNKPVWGTCPGFVANGSISFIGAAEGTDTVTPPAHQSGDTLIAIVVNEGGTSGGQTGGWTYGGLRFFSNFTSMMEIYYKNAVSSGETIGTFISADRVAVLVYRGVETSGWSISSPHTSNSATGSGVSVTYQSNNFWPNLSWKAPILAHESTDQTVSVVPSGITSRSNTNTTLRLFAGDTNASTSGYAGQTITVSGTSAGWATVTMTLRNKLIPA